MSKSPFGPAADPPLPPWLANARREPGGTDPRRAPGSIAGPGGPHERDSVVVDAANAVLFEGMEVTVINAIRSDGVLDPDPQLAMELYGRINQTQDRARIVFLFGADGAAAIVSQLMALAARHLPEYHDLLAERVDELLKDGDYPDRGRRRGPK